MNLDKDNKVKPLAIYINKGLGHLHKQSSKKKQQKQ